MTKVLHWLIFLCAALPAQDWKQSLTFHASFDKGPEADFALGDKCIYTAADYKSQMEAKPGLDHPDVTVVAGGVTGSALRFGKKNVKAIFYQGDKNIALRDGDWTGTISSGSTSTPTRTWNPDFVTRSR